MLAFQLSPKIQFLSFLWKVVQMDTNLSGWGLIYISLPVQGTWSPQEPALPISILDLRARRLPLLHWTPLLHITQQMVQLDKAMAVACINYHKRTRSQAALKEASLITSFLAIYILGVENYQADFLSHQHMDSGEWFNTPKIFLMWWYYNGSLVRTVPRQWLSHTIT